MAPVVKQKQPAAEHDIMPPHHYEAQEQLVAQPEKVTLYSEAVSIGQKTKKVYNWVLRTKQLLSRAAQQGLTVNGSKGGGLASFYLARKKLDAALTLLVGLGIQANAVRKKGLRKKEKTKNPKRIAANQARNSGAATSPWRAAVAQSRAEMNIKSSRIPAIKTPQCPVLSSP